MSSLQYNSAFNTSFNVPEDFQFSSDLFADFEPQFFAENEEIVCNKTSLLQSSKKICKSSVSDIKEASKPSQQRRARKGRNPWTPKEDALLVDLMKKYGQSWAMISSALPGRTGKQVRDRFLNKLRPHIRCGDWSVEEDELIVSLSKEIGNRWSLIATHLPGRTEAQVKNRYYSHIKKRLDSNGALSQTTASRTISEGFSSLVTSPQTDELAFDFRQGYNFGLFNGSEIQSVNQVPVNNTEQVDFALEAQNDFFFNQPSSYSVFAPIEHDNQIDDMLNQVTSHFSTKTSNDVDSYFSEDLNNIASAENLIFSSQEVDSKERFEQLSKRKAYLELALAKTLKEMKGF